MAKSRQKTPVARTASKYPRRPPVDPKVLAAKVAARMPLTVDEFCVVHNICRATFYLWQRARVGPAMTQPAGRGGRSTISWPAIDTWTAAQSRTGREAA